MDNYILLFLSVFFILGIGLTTACCAAELNPYILLVYLRMFLNCGPKSTFHYYVGLTSLEQRAEDRASHTSASKCMTVKPMKSLSITAVLHCEFLQAPFCVYPCSSCVTQPCLPPAAESSCLKSDGFSILLSKCH